MGRDEAGTRAGAGGVARRGLAALVLTLLLACGPLGAPDDDSGDDDATDPADDDSGDDDSGDDDSAATALRSALYPADWAPGLRDAQGRGLADFSYAGYRRSEVPLPSPQPDGALDVLAYGADPTGASDATASIQSAIDAAAAQGGGVVHLPEGLYRIDGLLRVEASGVVLLGDGSARTRLRFTRSEGMTDTAHLTFAGAASFGPDLPLAADGARDAHDLLVADASSLAVGDAVAVGFVVTPEFVAEHGMQDFWQVANGQWRAFFRREVVAIDTAATPHRVTVDVPLRHDVLARDAASVRRWTGTIEECGLVGVSVATAGAWSAAWAVDRSHAVLLREARDCFVRDVASFRPDDLPPERPEHLLSGGVKVLDSARVTLADVHFGRAQNRGGGGNGYLVEVSRSGEVLIRDASGVEGRHNFIQNWDFGTSGVVWLRVRSAGGFARLGPNSNLGDVGASEYHHSLAMANLVDDATIEDAWKAVNRRTFSSGAGHTATESVFWNVRGAGSVTSFQYGHGYVIGTSGGLATTTALDAGGIFAEASGTAPEDWTEALGEGDRLEPASLFLDQLARRIGR